MKNLRLLAVSAMVAITLLLGIQSTSYGLAYRIIDVTNAITVTVPDNGIGDSDPNVGLINSSIVGGIGGNWIVNSGVGITKPLFGSAASPWMDLNTIHGTSINGGGHVIVILSETGFTGPISGGIAGPFAFKVGGTTGGAVTFQSFLDDSDLNYWDVGATPVLLGSATTIGSPFAITFSGSAPANGTFSLTMWADITHLGQATTSFNEELKTGKIPEPISLILLGSGLAGAGLYRRLRKPRG